jgi:hypothetical protein
MFVNFYLKGGKEREHDRLYVQFDSPVTTLELSLAFFVWLIIFYLERMNTPILWQRNVNNEINNVKDL